MKTLLGTILVLALAGPARAQVKTNLDLASEVAEEVVVQLLADLPAIPTRRGVLLQQAGKEEIYSFLANVFTSILTHDGIKVYSGKNGSDSSSTHPLRLRFQALKFNLSYPKIYRSYLVGGRKVKRRVEMRLFAELSDPDSGVILGVAQAERDYQDQFPYQMISRVEEGLFDFTKPPRRGKKWSRVIEPMVVGAIVVGLIYLFYSNQSGS